MKTFICLSLVAFAATAHAQSIVGDWQLVRETNCMEESIADTDDTTAQMMADMKSMTGPSAQVVSFKEKLTGEESTRILTRKKSANNKSFLYKFDGEMLLILDKKSQTITENFIVDKFSTDSLILSSAARPCETKIFLRIK